MKLPREAGTSFICKEMDCPLIVEIEADFK